MYTFHTFNAVVKLCSTFSKQPLTQHILQLQEKTGREVRTMQPLTDICTLERSVSHHTNTLSKPPPLRFVFQERLKASEHRPEMEDKAEKRHAEPKPRPSSVSSPSRSPVLHPRKPPVLSRSPTPSTSSFGPLPLFASPVTGLKREDDGQRVSSHPPLPQQPHPRSASPPTCSPRRPKLEVGRREQREGQKPDSAPFQGIYAGEFGGIQSAFRWTFSLYRCFFSAQSLTFVLKRLVFSRVFTGHCSFDRSNQ